MDQTSKSDPGMRGNDTESTFQEGLLEGGEQSRGRTLLRMPRSDDITKGSKKTVTSLTFKTGPGNNVAPTSRSTEQPAQTIASQLDSQSSAETRAASIRTVKAPTLSATTPVKEMERGFHVDISHEPGYLDGDLAAEELFPDDLILDTITTRDFLGKGGYGQVHAVKVLGCGERVKRRLIELNLGASEVPKDYRVALKTLTWAGAHCQCSRCVTLNQLRRRKGLAPCPIFLPHHVLRCGTTRTLPNEIAYLKRLVGIAGMQQLIGYEVYEGETGGKLVSKSPLLRSDDTAGKILRILVF